MATVKIALSVADVATTGGAVTGLEFSSQEVGATAAAFRADSAAAPGTGASPLSAAVAKSAGA